MTTEDFVEHDICARKRTWGARYRPFRVSLNWALNDSLYAALAGNDPKLGSERLLSWAANPGIDLSVSDVYSPVVHHSKLVELLATYILAIEKCSVPPALDLKWGQFQPKSFLLPDGRLRRIVLVDRWTPEREQLERFSWRTAADTAITNRPMLITAIVIGSARAGYRPSPWTTGYVHPQNGGIRVQRREGEFSDTWQKVYREQTSTQPLEWLKIMQNDGAFEGRVVSVVEDVPPNREEVLEQLAEMAGEINAGSVRQSRSSCYRFTPCPFLPACSTARMPPELGWVEREKLVDITINTR